MSWIILGKCFERACRRSAAARGGSACWRPAPWPRDRRAAPASAAEGHHDAARQEGHGPAGADLHPHLQGRSPSSRSGSSATTAATTTSRPIPICNWSGELGPKVKQGDRQAPEGFYTITREQMNPNSKYHLAMNLGYPNAYDRSHRRTGEFLMIHGKCKSAGCYAMTDALMEEIYAHGARVLPGRPRQLPGARLPVPHDGREHGPLREPRGLSVLEDAEGGLRLLRADAAGAGGGRLQPALRASMSPSAATPRGSIPRAPARSSSGRGPTPSGPSPASRSPSQRIIVPGPKTRGLASFDDGTQRSGLMSTGTIGQSARPPPCRAWASPPAGEPASAAHGHLASAGPAQVVAGPRGVRGRRRRHPRRTPLAHRLGRYRRSTPSATAAWRWLGRHAARRHARPRRPSRPARRPRPQPRRPGLHPHLQARVRARALDEAGGRASTCSPPIPSAAGRARSAPSCGRATPGTRGLLHGGCRRAEPGEPLAPLLQPGLSQRLRPRPQPHRLLRHGARRLRLDRLLCHDGPGG